MYGTALDSTVHVPQQIDGIHLHVYALECGATSYNSLQLTYNIKQPLSMEQQLLKSI